jgi:energy-coupling factor transporter ATP-binding protein EcfA2
MPAFSVRDVWFGYAVDPVLRGVSLTVGEGERVALLGRNGVGKTTLTRLLVALLHPQRGSVEVTGRATEGLAPEDLADVTAYVFQHPDQQLFAKTVRDEVAFGPLQRGATAAEVAERVGAALEVAGLVSHAATHPYDLGPAERKLVTLAAALAQHPRVLLLDEPTQGLDRAGMERVAEIVRAVARDGVAVLGVTHDLTLVAEAFDRAVVLEDGRVAFDAAVRELVHDAERLDALGLNVPPAARLASMLRLPGFPFRVREVSEALRRRRVEGGFPSGEPRVS